jgi:glyoxylate reductase
VDPRVWEEEPPPSRDVPRAEAARAEGLVTLLTDRVDAGLPAEAPGLRGVSSVAVGYDNIDVQACTTV